MSLALLAEVSAAPDGLLGPFRQFSTLHLAVVTLLVLGISAVCAAGVRLRAGPEGERREARFRRTIACVMVAWMVMETSFYLFARPWDPAVSLPLHFCDVGAWLAPIMLLSRVRVLRAILYYWTCAFTIQAYVTPTLEEGPTQWRFYLFWMSHTWIIGAAVYDFVVLRFRPTWGDWVRATSLTFGFVLFLIFAVNIPFGLNYGFLGQSKPERPTIIDSLGPYPERVYLMCGASIAAFAVLTAIWPANWPRGRARSTEAA